MGLLSHGGCSCVQGPPSLLAPGTRTAYSCLSLRARSQTERANLPQRHSGFKTDDLSFLLRWDCCYFGRFFFAIYRLVITGNTPFFSLKVSWHMSAHPSQSSSSLWLWWFHLCGVGLGLSLFHLPCPQITHPGPRLTATTTAVPVQSAPRCLIIFTLLQLESLLPNLPYGVRFAHGTRRGLFTP